jgi:hypothetical protein
MLYTVDATLADKKPIDAPGIRRALHTSVTFR